ncbi:MAG TPA: CHASE sensor domain-containing protein, partial [Burkholderiaceae bacterium]|nr:CHASE sensor domain-containing protein [Burkholderiaceae bacterium]
MSPVRQPLLQALRAAHVRLGLAAVIAAGIVLTMVSLLTLRTVVEQNLQLVARSIAYTAEAATVFNDPASAVEAVSLIAAQEGLLRAEIVRRNGSTLARYVRDGDAGVDGTLARAGTLLFPLQARAPVTHQGAEFGQVVVQGNGGVYVLYLIKVVAAVAGCMAVIGWWVSRLSRRIEHDIVRPLNSLASLTRTARTERSLGLRAPAAVV